MVDAAAFTLSMGVGTVVGPDGEPPVGFRLAMAGDNGRHRWLPMSGTRGRFHTGSLPAGTWTLSVDTPSGKASVTVELEAGEHVEGLELTLSNRTILSGRLVDGDGVPLTGYLLGVVDAGTERTIATVRAHASTDRQGRFKLENLTGDEGNLELIAGTESSPEALRAAPVLLQVKPNKGESQSLGDITVR